jgi:hypothetical protein
MPNRTCFVMRPAFGIQLAALAVFTLLDAPARAATACHAAPNAAASPGEHWYYRTDRATKRQCWYLAARGRSTIRTAADEDALAQAKRSSVATTNDHGTPEMSVRERVQRFIFGFETARTIDADANAAPATAYAAPSPQGHRIVHAAETPAERKAPRTVAKPLSVTTMSDQGAEETSTRDRVPQQASPRPVDADANAPSVMAYAASSSPAVPPPWPASAQPVGTFDSVRLAMSAPAAAEPPAREASADDVTADASSSEPAYPARTVSQVGAEAGAPVTPAQIIVAALVMAGALLYVAVELALVWRRRVRVQPSL